MRAVCDLMSRAYSEPFIGRCKVMAMVLLAVTGTEVAAPWMAVGAEDDGDASKARRAITLDDIVATTRPRDVQISPDGTRIAFVVTSPVIDENRLTHRLHVVDADGDSAPTFVYESATLTQLTWRPGHEALVCLSTYDGRTQLVQIDIATRSVQPLTPTAAGVTAFAFSPDGQRVALVTRGPGQTAIIDDAKRDGLVMPSTASGYDLANQTWGRGSPEVRIVDFVTKRELPPIAFERKTSATLLAWTQKGDRLIVLTQSDVESARDKHMWRRDVTIVGASSGRIQATIPWSGFVSSARLSPDGSRLAIVGVRIDADGFINGSQQLYVLDLEAQAVTHVDAKAPLRSVREVIGWERDGASVYVEGLGSTRSIRGLFQVRVGDGASTWKHAAPGHHSSCSVTTDRRRAACITESPSMPPDVAVVELNDGRLRPRTDLNPRYRDIRLSDAVELPVVNRFGVGSSSFLIKPLDYQKDRRYPLVVILYRFTGEFFVDKFGNYPIQAFAAAGHAVLLVNIANPGYHAFNAEEGMRSEAYGPLDTIERAVAAVIETGLADRERIGLMGWSYGSFLVDFAISHSRTFAVASSGDGGLYNPSTYWASHVSVRAQYEAVMGGPPMGPTLERWLELSPVLNAHRIVAPLMMEYVSANYISPALYVALQRLHAPVELIVYPGGVHVFNDGVPSHRRASLERNLDWFNYWLLDARDPNPKKTPQYERWDRLRARRMEQDRRTAGPD